MSHLGRRIKGDRLTGLNFQVSRMSLSSAVRVLLVYWVSKQFGRFKTGSVNPLHYHIIWENIGTDWSPRRGFSSDCREGQIRIKSVRNCSRLSPALLMERLVCVDISLVGTLILFFKDRRGCVLAPSSVFLPFRCDQRWVFFVFRLVVLCDIKKEGS